MKKNENNTLGTLFVVIAGLCWGLISIFVRRLTACGLSSLQIICIRACLSALMLLAYFLIRNPKALKIRLRDIWVFAGTGILSLTFFSYCYFSSIVRSGAAVAVVLLYTSPIFVMLMSAVVFREKITGKKVIALIMTFAGCILVAGLVGSGAKLSIGALILGLGAGFGYALYSIFAGLALKKGYSSLTITFYTFLLSAISLLILSDVGDMALKITESPATAVPCGIGIAFICTVIPYLTYTLGLERMEAGKAAVLVTVEPLVGTVLGILCYHEPADVFNLTGIVLIFAAVILLSVEKKPKSE